MPPLLLDFHEQESGPSPADQDKITRPSIITGDLQLTWTGYPRWRQWALQNAPVDQYIAEFKSNPARFMAQLKGEFSLAAWDRQSGSVFFTRDITGTYPLYYQQGQDQIRIASSLSCFSKTGDLNLDFLCCWLLNRYPENITPYQEIDSLPSGYCGQFTNQQLQIRRMDTPDGDQVSDVELASEIIREALFASIRDRCGKDDRLATHLSGGMDSTSVAAALCQTANINGSTAYHYYHPSMPACDESKLTRVVAQYLRLPLKKIDAKPYGIYRPYKRQAKHELPFYSWDDLDAEIFRHMLEHEQYDLFTGHAGDVLFTGPGPVALLTDQLIANPGSVFSLLFNQERNFKSISLRNLSKSLFYDAAHQHGWPLLRLLGIKPGRLPWLRSKVFENDELWDDLSGQYETFSTEQYGLSARLLNAGTSGIRRAIHSFEKHAGNYSIRTHHPFWTQRMIAAMLSIDPELLRFGGHKKGLLRQAMMGLLPDAVLQSQHKPTYVEYYHQSIQQQKARLTRLLQHSRLADLGLIKPEKVIAELEQYNTSGANQVARFLAVIDLEIWLQNK